MIRSSFCCLFVAGVIVVMGCTSITGPGIQTAAETSSVHKEIIPTSENLQQPSGGAWKPYILNSIDEIKVPPPPSNLNQKTLLELAEVRQAVLEPSAYQRSIVTKWNIQHQTKRWRIMMDQLIIDSGMGAPSMSRAYAVLHLAMADAILAAWNYQYKYRRARPYQLNSDIKPWVSAPQNPAYPSDRAAAAGAAERILRYFFPEDYPRIRAMADEAVDAQIMGGLNLRSDCEAGRALGQEVANRVIAKLEKDGRPSRLIIFWPTPWEQPFSLVTRPDVEFRRTSSVYSDEIRWDLAQAREKVLVGESILYGDKLPWTPALSVDPSAGTWKPFLIDSVTKFECPPPPANSDPETARDMDEIILVLNNRTSYSDHIVYKWAQDQPAHWFVLQLEELLERYQWSPPREARAKAIFFSAIYDSLIACFKEKYRYLRARPVHLEPALPTVISTPRHPSYPSGHAALAGAADAVLRYFFPENVAEYSDLLPEVNNARVWAGIHFRGDQNAGAMLGARVAEAVLGGVKPDGSLQDN